MRKIFLIISFCLLIVTSLQAGEKGVEVRPSEKELLEAEPKRIVTTVFQVTNKTSEKREFTSDVKLPEGWILITRDFPFDLEANKSDIRLVSFFIPQTTLAGKYEITYLVKGRKYPSISDFYTIFVVVLPVTKLEVKLLEAPEYVIAGEDYRASFVVMNQSNIQNTVSIKVDSGGNLPFTLDTEKLQLASGESKKVTVSVETDVKIRKLLKHRLELTVEVLENDKVKAKDISFVEIIPKITGVEERFHRIPVEMTFRYVTEKDEGDKSGFQTEISGGGTLDEEEKRHIKFLFRGPDIQDKSIFGERDEYRLSYWTKDYELHFGDRSYSLSPLTENYRYGRGIEGRLKLNNFTLGAYQMKTRWLEPEKEQTAAYIDYLIHEKYRIGFNYLKKKLMMKMVKL